jgi:hypothetical protein
MPNTNRRTVDRLFDVIADSLRAMSDQELGLLLDGKGKLGFISAYKEDNDLDAERASIHAAKEMAEKLAEVESREAARKLIGAIEHPKRRDFLVRIAQEAGVRIGTKDSVARIEQKLIQATVGSKLRSRAFKEVSF